MSEEQDNETDHHQQVEGKIETEEQDEERDDDEHERSLQEVKSTAVVKYTAVQVPVKFARLQCNTDLNLPPSNWLSSSAETYGLQHVLSHSTGFSSFRMAHMFPDCMGEVDVVSDAENIKKLLKIPYSRDAVSMMVHCIEKTLLIDEFDVHKYLLRTAESDWEWLRKFFYEHILQTLGDKEKRIPHKDKSRYALQQRALTSKFLHYSIAESDAGSECESEFQNNNASKPIDDNSSVPVKWPPLPEPRLEEELPDPATDHTFNRNVVWTFEDIQMLLGIDMPIFGGSTHPCISLRLRDMAKPISVLTGIDYWLDNLMCNVPEVVMCYHLNGIVQRYELVKTEDLPHLEDSKFSPKIIRDVAQNILSFLKSNATKAGHTYWLFKGKDEDIVKLYDLTCLCSDGLIDKGQNPFTVPVAMLLYRVARNMKYSADNASLQPGTIRMLLKNCLALLPKEKYPQIVTSAHYMLSDLYIPVSTDPTCPRLSDEQPASANCEDEDCDEDETQSDAIKSLCISQPQPIPSPKYTPPPPLVGSLEERCRSALEHVAAGLHCLQYFEGQPSTTNETDNTNMCDENTEKTADREPRMARPHQAIPMPYSPLTQQPALSGQEKSAKKKIRKKKSEGKSAQKKATIEQQKEENVYSQLLSHCWDEYSSPKTLLCKPHTEALPTWQQPDRMDNASWNTHLKILLYEKACLVYIILAESEYQLKRFGSALRYIKYVLRCNWHKLQGNSWEQRGLISFLLGRAGDCCIQLALFWDDILLHRADFSNCSDIDIAMEIEMKRDLDNRTYPSEVELVPDSLDDLEQLMLSSSKCYEYAHSLEPSNNLKRRIGNVHNELSAYYMNKLTLEFQNSNGNNKEDIEKYFDKAQFHLDQGQSQFELAKDDSNLALLQSNTGKLMRLLAHRKHDKDSEGMSSKEKHYYNKALEYYKKALSVLRSRKTNPLIWDTITWEQSTTLINMAAMCQDNPPPVSEQSREECERECIDLLTKALHACDLETPGPRYDLYQYRAGIINHRLASLYHQAYRTMSSEDPRRKNYLHLANLHYERASDFMQELEHPVEFLRLQLERVALQEFIAENSGFNSKVKALQSGLDLLIKCKVALCELSEKHNARRKKSSKKEPNVHEDKGDSTGEDDQSDTEEKSMLNIFQSRLQFILRMLVKLCMSSSNARLVSMTDKYKDMYSQVLKQKEDTSLVDHLSAALKTCDEIL